MRIDKRLAVRVDVNEIYSAQLVRNHSVNGIVTAAAYADNLYIDSGIKLFKLFYICHSFSPFGRSYSKANHQFYKHCLIYL